MKKYTGLNKDNNKVVGPLTQDTEDICSRPQIRLDQVNGEACLIKLFHYQKKPGQKR